MQPDREDAERDDAAVEVAAHFFLSLRAACSFVFCEPFAPLASSRALCVAAVVKTLFVVAFGPK